MSKRVFKTELDQVNTTLQAQVNNSISKTIVDAKGDIVTASAADTPIRLAVGANDLLLMAASGETTGLKWGGTWTTWTPTLYNITAGNGTTQARYVVIGKTVFAEFHFTFGSTSALTGVPQFSLPVAAKLLSYTFCGAATLGDYGTASYYAGCNMIPGNIVSFTAVLANGTYAVETAPSATVPFTWTTNDYLTARISYEAA